MKAGKVDLRLRGNAVTLSKVAECVEALYWFNYTDGGNRVLNLRKLGRHLVFHIARRLNVRLMTGTVLGDDMLLDLRTDGISSQLFVHGIREPEHTELVRELVRPGMRCLDVGANLGYYSLLMGEIVGEKGHVYAFEPDSRNIPVLRANIGLRGISDQVSVFQMAISDKSGTAILSDSGPSNLSSIAHGDSSASQTDSGRGSSVPAVSLHDLRTLGIEFVDFIRMDVEGAEGRILGIGASSFLSKMPVNSTIFIEVHPDHYSRIDDFAASVRNLWKLGFRDTQVVSSGKKPSKDLLSSHGSKVERRFSNSGFDRVLVRIDDLEQLVHVVTHSPKIVRYVVLRKTTV